MEIAKEKVPGHHGALWLAVTACGCAVVMLAVIAGLAYQSLDEMRGKVEQLAAHAKASAGQSEYTHDPNVQHYNPMQRLEQRLQGISNSGNRSYDNRLDALDKRLNELRDIEDRVSTIDGKKRGYSVGMSRYQGGLIGELESRVDDLESDLGDLHRAMKRLAFELNYGHDD